MKEAENIGERQYCLENLSNKELLSHIKNDSQDAFSFLYRKYVKELFDYGKFLVRDKDVIEDAIHDVFVNIWSSRKNHIEIHSVKAYLFISVRRAVLKKKKDNAKREYSCHDLMDRKLGEQASFEEYLISDESEMEKIQRIRDSINHLSDRQREIIYLRYFKDISYDEIAQLLEIDKNYAYNLISKAFTHLKKDLKGVFSYSLFFLSLFLNC